MNIKGFMLLPISSIKEYKGVDRCPFEPLLIDEEIDNSTSVDESNESIWILLKDGWRKDAYRLFEQNMVQDKDDNIALLSNLKVAIKIKNLIEPYIGSYEIVECQVTDLDSVQSLKDDHELSTFLGYDIAYKGGDYFSALQGLIVNPNPSLVKEFSAFLNENLLFESTQVILKYVSRFKELVPSEKDSIFYLYHLKKAEDTA